MSSLSSTDNLVAHRILLQGQVQGVGYRPALARLASTLGLSGWVRNTGDGVEVHIEGPVRQVQQFANQCGEVCPAGGVVDSTDDRLVEVQNFTSFSIASGTLPTTLATQIPVDLVTCRRCSEEVNDPTNRRYGYLLTSCSQCGPRYTILEQMPYERETTSMRRFLLCDNCQAEYTSPVNRRFHAQTTCCSHCGPNLTSLNLKNIAHCLEYLRAGKIVCIKGIGGYQLLADALNATAIQRLRSLKGRYDKPFAVMIRGIQYADDFGMLQSLERELLQSKAAPIVVVRDPNGSFADEVCNGLASLGLMLPTSPLHEWLTGEIGPLVVTSGNLEGEPILFEDNQACESLKKMADVCINHDRPILRPIDDSVVRVMGQQVITLRLARGLAPLSLDFGPTLIGGRQHILAVGAHQKVAVALANGAQQLLGPHLGDMETLASRQRFVDHVQDLTRLYHADPTVVVHDQHDDYFTTRWSANFAIQNRIRTLAVQHHHAHIVSAMIEPRWLDREVLGVAWDGTGLGTDGTIWGGEFLKATSTGFERIASLRPFVMPGGEAAIREPQRLATALVREVCAWDANFVSPIKNDVRCDWMITQSLHAPVTTSMGRLFDAVAALVLPSYKLPSRGRGLSGSEGHLAALLESVCDLESTGIYPMPLCEASSIDFPGGQRLATARTLDWRPLLRSILEDIKQNTAPATIAMRFHRTLAFAVQQVSGLFESLPVVLGGGVFQNKILVDLIAEDFANRSIPIAIPSSIPINDGGLAAGQLAIASAILAKEQRCV